MTDNTQARKPKNTGYRVSVVALVIAIVALLLMWNSSPSGSDNTAPNPFSTACATPSPGASGAPGIPGADGKPGLSAYDLWVSLGNKGSVQDFLDSLIGEPGLAGESTVYRGTNGLTGLRGQTGAEGEDGEAGRSAYQIWLDLGNTGSPVEFITALTGEDGIDGLSAYELWVANGNSGSEEDFFDSLAGVDGTPGVNGTNGVDGLSAYQIWLNAGNVGGEGDFLASLVGTDGVDGAPGACEPGPKGDPGASGAPGIAGANGASAYEIWLSQDNVGSVEVFLASLQGLQGEPGPAGSPGPVGAVGPTGPAGPQGEPGPVGPTGPPGVSGSGYFGSFYDMTNQSISSGQAAAWKFSNVTGSTNGVQIVSAGNGSGNTRIKFPVTGWYNISFSTVFAKSNASAGDVDVWFAENGIAIPDSNTRLTVAGQSQAVAAWNYFYHCTDPNDYVEVMWYTTEHLTISVATNPPSTNPTRPAVPSIILTVNQIG